MNFQDGFLILSIGPQLVTGFLFHYVVDPYFQNIKLSCDMHKNYKLKKNTGNENCSVKSGTQSLCLHF